jgi:hypothetical protein
MFLTGIVMSTSHGFNLSEAKSKVKTETQNATDKELNKLWSHLLPKPWRVPSKVNEITDSNFSGSDDNMLR